MNPDKNSHLSLLQEIEKDITEAQYQRLKNALEGSRHELQRVPLLVPLLGTFGLVATLYGFEKILDQTNLADYPLYMIGLGVFLLLLTGAAATKL